MNERDSRLVHALAELVGLAATLIALDRMSDGAISQAAGTGWAWLRKSGIGRYLSMWHDATQGAPATLAEAERIKDA